MNQSETALRLAGSLWGFWYARGHLSEGRYWLEQSLARGDGTTKSRAKVLYGTGVLAEVQGDLAQAVSFYEQARELYRSIDDVRGVGLVLGNLGDVAAKQGRYEEARSLYDEALAVQRGTGDQRAVTAMLINLGNLASLQGDHDRAAALHAEALDLAQGLGDRWLTALAHGNLAGATRDQGHLEQAVGLYRRALLMWQELGGTEGVIDCLAGLACTASAQGQPERAARLFGAAEGLAEATNHPVMPVDHALYEASLEAARSALGSDAFEAARADGRAMRLEDAIAEAAGIEVVLQRR